ncbi:MAG: c-type cytochrome [Elusimicrobia bacterium]|nr:c-type cytochrome [Elusimicrobiota bacterium]
MSLRKLFNFFNLSILLVFLIAFWIDYHREWKIYQRAYYQKTADSLGKKLATLSDPEQKKALKTQIKFWRKHPLEIKQIIAKDLGRVDRCITCHVAMDEFTNPSLTSDIPENPYKAHPDLAVLVKNHPLQKYGCTTCHAGQGLSTTLEEAHYKVTEGHTVVWEEPILKQPYIQASCAKCHADFEKLRGAEMAALGKDLFQKHGCIGCHQLKGVGGVISVDLGDIADKPLARIAPHNFEEAGVPHDKYSVQSWIEAHLTKDPMDFVSNDPLGKFNAEPIAPSGMPPYYKELKEKEAKALTTYLLSLSNKSIPKDYYVYASPKPEPNFNNAVEHGKYVFNKYGCQGCHGMDAKLGRRNFNALGPGQDSSKPWEIEEMAKGQEPTLVDVVGTYTRGELKKKIQDGVPASSLAKFNPDGPIPPLYMPSWREKIKGQELEDLVSYLLSIAKKQESW